MGGECLKTTNTQQKNMQASAGATVVIGFPVWPELQARPTMDSHAKSTVNGRASFEAGKNKGTTAINQ